MQNEKSNPDELIIIREINAPREMVYHAFTKAEQLKHWWAPKGFDLNVLDFNLVPGGYCHYGMVSKDFTMYGRFEYLEILPVEKVIFINAFADEKGQLIRSPWDANWPLEMLHVLTLTENNGITTLTFRVSPYKATREESNIFVAGFDDMRGGYGSALQALEAFLSKQ